MNSPVNHTQQPSENIHINKQMNQFKLSSFLDLYEELHTTNWAIKALSELIASSNLEFITDSASDSSDLRGGIKQLFELCVEKQERRMEVFYEAVTSSPEFAIERAKNTLGRFNNCRIPSPKTNYDIRKAIELVTTVLNVFGENEYPEALLIQNKLLDKTNA